MNSVQLSTDLCSRSAAEAYQTSGRVFLPRFFSRTTAVRLEREALAIRHWGVSIAPTGIDRDYIDSARAQNLTPTDYRNLCDLAYSQNGQGMAHFYESISLDDERFDGTSLQEAREFLRSQSMIGFLRPLFGDLDITVTSLVLTRYRTGHFYSSHHDAIDGESHIASFVISLTRNWRLEWGGLLRFPKRNLEVTTTFVPRFDSISIFQASQTHSVSAVSPGAQTPRISIAGVVKLVERG